MQIIDNFRERKEMTLKDISNGPATAILWIVFSLLLVISIILLSGHGSTLIAGYNTASKKEKERIDQKKLCRIVGAGLLPIAVLILIMAVFFDTLPSFFVYFFVSFTLLDTALIVILANTRAKNL